MERRWRVRGGWLRAWRAGKGTGGGGQAGGGRMGVFARLLERTVGR